MANWNLPTAISDYLDFVTEMNDKFVDAGTINYGAPTNLPEHAIRFNRSINIFEEWLAGVWVPKVIGVAGGGTGATTPAEIRINLGLGSMASQNSNAVAITGGTITGIGFSASDIISGIIPLARGGTGASLALGAPGTVMLSNGSSVVFSSGVNIAELNASNLTTGIVPLSRLSGVALLSAYNIFTARSDFNSNNSQSLTVVGVGGASINFYHNDAPVDKKYLRWIDFNGDMFLQSLTDTFGFGANLLQISNAGVLHVNGSGISNLDANNLTIGMVPNGRLASSGSPDSNNFLRGDRVWAPIAGASIPSGLIAMFATGCPVGWTRVAGLDGRFPRGSGGFGSTGGNSSHWHRVQGNTDSVGNHSHSVNISGRTDGARADQILVSSNAPVNIVTVSPSHDHNFGASGDTGNSGGHGHGLNIDSTEVSHIPPYMDVVFCQKD